MSEELKKHEAWEETLRVDLHEAKKEIAKLMDPTEMGSREWWRRRFLQEERKAERAERQVINLVEVNAEQKDRAEEAERKLKDAERIGCDWRRWFLEAERLLKIATDALEKISNAYCAGCIEIAEEALAEIKESKPNKETLRAIKDVEDGNVTSSDNIEAMINELNTPDITDGPPVTHCDTCKQPIKDCTCGITDASKELNGSS